MPEYHAGTKVEIPDAVPMSDFRNAIPNVKRYMKANRWEITDVATAAYEGDFAKLEMLLATGDEDNIFNGDLNEHVPTLTALQLAAQAGHAECIEILLRARADVHMRENMAYGKDPEDGRTALDMAKAMDWDDCAELLEKAEKEQKYGWYQPAGALNNAKVYNCFEWGKKPEKGWYMSRPGAAKKQGLDPRKFGTQDFEEKEVDLFKLPSSSAAPTQLAKPSVKPLPIGLLFPGQGSQYVRMMTTTKDIPAVKDMLAKAKTILGYDILAVCMNGPEEELEVTSVCQPAMFIAGLAGVEKLRAEREEAVTRCQVLSGLSLGEYTALCVAGVFSFEDGLKLVKVRGEAMQEAANLVPQSMLSVAGLDKAKLEPLCAEAEAFEGGAAVCRIANELFPKGFSCAGTQKAIQKLKELTEAAGALQAKLLKTSGGFHTSLMRPAAAKLGAALDELAPRLKSPSVPVFMNSTGAAVRPGAQPKEITELLKAQLTSPVLWEPCVRAMLKEGVTEFFEVGPMKQLKSMMKRIDQKAWGTMANVEV